MTSQTLALCMLATLVASVVAQYGHSSGHGSSYGGSSGGSGYGHGHHYVTDYYAHPKYSFHYGVHDPHTHDIKSHNEERDGDTVHGSYELVEPDGTKRVVKYSADHHTGFHAIVHREHNQHPTHYQTPHYEHRPHYSSHSSHY